MFTKHLDPSRSFIGFSRFKPDKQDYAAGDVITFTGIIMDEENYFKSNQFVCPVEGSYYFLLNLLQNGDRSIDIYLKHGDHTVIKLQSFSFSGFSTMFSNSAVITCLKGKYFCCNNTFNFTDLTM